MEFITDSESKKDVFVHHSNIIIDGFRHLDEDDIVYFELGIGKDSREQGMSFMELAAYANFEIVEKSA